MKLVSYQPTVTPVTPVPQLLLYPSYSSYSHWIIGPQIDLPFGYWLLVRYLYKQPAAHEIAHLHFNL